MELGILLLAALVLVCPISMMWMMRGRHRKHDMHVHGSDDRGQRTADPRDLVARPGAQQQVRGSELGVLGDEHRATTDVHRRRDSL